MAGETRLFISRPTTCCTPNPLRTGAHYTPLLLLVLLRLELGLELAVRLGLNLESAGAAPETGTAPPVY